MYLIQIHDVADFGGQFFLRSDFGAFIFAQNFVDQAAGGGIQHRNFLGHQPGHEIIQWKIGVLRGDKTPIALVLFRALILRSLLGRGQIFHLAVIHTTQLSPLRFNRFAEPQR